MHRVSPLVTTKWLSKVLTPASPGIRVLDSTLRNSPDHDPYKDYLREHIPGARFFDIDECCDQTSPYSHTLPHPTLFGDYVGHLGITNDTHVVVYDNHEKFTLFSSPRTWWLFRVFGHQRVSVLEGGLPKWISEGHSVTPEVMQTDKTDYDVKYQPQLVKRFEDMVRNIDSQNFQVMDARSAERFDGTAEEARKGLKVGHIPGSKSLPFFSLFNEETRTLKSPEELKQIYENNGIDLSGPLAATCGSGITACVIALGAHLCGKEDVSVFDGSWEEYGRRASDDQVAKGS